MNPVSAPADGRKKRGPAVAAILVPAFISVFFVWMLMRGLSWQRLAGNILSASPVRLALYGAIALGALWLRAVRFRILLADAKPAVAPVFFTTLIQNALGDLVPARLASLGSYVWFMNRRLAVSTASAASTFIVSFVLDLVTLGPLLLIAVAVRFGLAAPANGSSLPLGWTAVFAAAFFAASAAAAWWLGPLIHLVGKLPRALGRGLGGSVWTRIEAFLERTAASLDAVRRGGVLMRALAVSMAIRIAKYAALFALTESLLAGSGNAAAHPGLWDLIIGVSATELVASLPVPAIGQFGVWEGGMVGALVMLGFPREPATLVAFGVHGITTAYEYVLALIALGGLFLLSRKKNKIP
jgi:uncharacterized membrane protein YbhN (UPF0104 family)